MSAENLLSSDDVGKIVELAVEPSYISEIARKLQEVDPNFQNFSLNSIIQLVSRSVFVLEQDDRVEVIEPPLGGLKESSPKTSLSGEGFAEKDMWREYTIVNTVEVPSEIREGFLDIIDTDVTVDDKVEITDFLSRSGKIMAERSEEILEEVVRDTVDFDFISTATFNSPDEDVYIEVGGMGYLLEISVRWVNPISTPYINRKFELAAEFEQNRDIPVDLIIMAPNFTRRAQERSDDSEILELRNLPEGNGFPVMTTDVEPRNVFQDDLETVFRDFNAVSEQEYRAQIEDVLEELVI